MVSLFDKHDFYTGFIGASIKWRQEALDSLGSAAPGAPLCVATYGDGGFGERVYANCTPAHKSTGTGP